MGPAAGADVRASSFLRTYAQALGLDAKALVEEYRLNYERPSEAALEPIVSTPSSSPARATRARRGPSRGYMALVAIVGVVIVLLVIGLLSEGGGSPSNTTAGTTTTAQTHDEHARTHRAPTGTTRASDDRRIARGRAVVATRARPCTSA